MPELDEPTPVTAAIERSLRVPLDDHARAALGVVDRLRQAGYAAYPVGGCARDLVVGAAPKDWDVATAARPEQVRALFGKVIEVGAAFGVLRVPAVEAEQRFEIEVATFRADGPYGDGRRPDRVRFTDAREDVLRRDFTLNGLLLDPAAQDGPGDFRSARVVDWVGGLADLHARLLRAIGRPADRFAEDSLRLLRAVRFAARFDLTVEPETRAAIRRLAGGLASVSPERVRAELAGALQLPWAARAVRLLADLGLHTVLWPPLAEVDPGFERAARRMARLGEELNRRIDAEGGFAPQRDLDLPLALAALLFDIGPQTYWQMRDTGRDMRLSLAEGRRLAAIWSLDRELVANRALWLGGLAADTPPPALIRHLRSDRADAALLLRLADTDPDSPTAAGLRALRRLRAGAERAAWRPRPWITGATLKSLGHAPSAGFRFALLAAEDVQLAGGNRESALVAALTALESARLASASSTEA